MPRGQLFKKTKLFLKFRANSIKNAPKINEDPKDALLRQYEEQIKLLKEQLEAVNGGNVIYREVEVKVEKSEKNVLNENDDHNDSSIKKKLEHEKKMLHSEKIKMENNFREKEMLLSNHNQEKDKLLLRIQELEREMNKKVVSSNL